MRKRSTLTLAALALLACSDRPVPEPRGDGQSGDPCTSDADCEANSVCFNDVCVQQGIFRVSLSWSAVTDLDLHVRTPSGDEVSFSLPEVAGGSLDVDDCVGGLCSNPDGTHVENIFFNSTAAEGTYRAWVVNFDGLSAADFQVEVAGAVTESWSGQLSAEGGAMSEVFVFNWPAP
ncbi:MAG: hypothetical protein IPK80_29875 [Nannocystis sp.]|nr:hypothetical protein [Nannocystis sp.]